MSTALAPQVFRTPEEARLFAGYTDEVKADILWKLQTLAPALNAPRGMVGCIIAAIAERQGMSVSGVRRWYDFAKAGDLHALANKSRDVKMQRHSRVLLPSADIMLWQGYCLRYQRDGGCAAAYRQMLRDWRAGKITTTQPVDPMSQRPAGWSKSNLYPRKPADYSLAGMRGGRNRASDYRPQVLTTRAGLRCGQYLVGDDVWHDHVVHWRGQRTPVRPLEASVLDLFPGFLCQWGLRPRLLRADGTRENLTEKEVRWVIAATLRGYGYRADEIGTTWLVESGTFAIRDKIAGPLQDAFGIKVESSSIMGDKAWFGAYGTKGGGNPRFKTWLESIHSLRHNEMSALPGQVGRSRDHTPEEHKGLVKYAERIADMEERLALVAPELAARVAKPVQTYHEFVDLCERVYGFMNTRRDHALEGWRECGHEIVQYLLGTTLLDEADFLALPPPPSVEIAEWGRSFAERGLTRTRLLSPAEVAAAGRKELSPLPTHGVSLILGADLGREQRVDAGEFTWSDPDIHQGGELCYFAEITTPEGRRELLKNGESYLVHANPFWLEELCVSDAKGRFMGVARRHDRASRADREAMQAQYKAVAEHEAKLMDELAKTAAPILRERMATREANIGTLEHALQSKERAAEVRKVDRIDTAQLLARRAKAAGGTENEACQPASNKDASWQ
jgi:hypothetical protein